METIIPYFDEMQILQDDKLRRTKTAKQFINVMARFFDAQLLDACSKKGLSQNRFSPKYIQKKVPETCKSSKFPELSLRGFPQKWNKIPVLRQPLFHIDMRENLYHSATASA